MVNVGKNTSPMDPMGYTSRRLRHVRLLTFAVFLDRAYEASEFNPENRAGPKRKRLYSNHPFSGAMQAFSLGSVDVSMISCFLFQNL